MAENTLDEYIVLERHGKIPAIIGEVSLISHIASGGYGVVYKGIHNKDKKFVAVKFQNPEYFPKLIETEYEYSKLLGTGSSKHLPFFYGKGEILNTDGTKIIYLVYEFIPNKVTYGTEKMVSDMFNSICDLTGGVVMTDPKLDNIRQRDDGTLVWIDMGEGAGWKNCMEVKDFLIKRIFKQITHTVTRNQLEMSNYGLNSTQKLKPKLGGSKKKRNHSKRQKRTITRRRKRSITRRQKRSITRKKF